MSENKVAEAEPYLQEAVKLDPLFVDALDHLGIVYRRQEKYEEAEKIYLQSLALNDKNAVSYINLALVYRNLNRWEDALKMYIKLNELDPEDPEAYYGIGELLQMAGDYEASKEFFYEAIKKYIAVESDLVYDALYCQGINHYELGEYEDALECFGYAEEAYPEDENLLELIRETEKMVKK
ncbi:hypothetical protein AGMMS49928_02100 [Spirochaetia bacterium]|nr:hypothetical protein AGMMS49928_02100 [Spirochaetia bacterium]